MTKNVILAGLSLFIGAAIHAQAPTNTDNVTLNIKLKPIQTLVVNNAADQKTVDLVYETTGDYQNGKSETKQNHLAVYSTGGFVVKVKSAAANFNGPKGDLQTNSVTITPAAGSNDPIAGAQYSTQTLQATEQEIVKSTTGTVNGKINVTYKGAGANAYLNYYVAGQTPTVYTTQVTYTIISQ
ncbi:hypothetical protein LQ567_24775 [Niabella pedocola]|uniref:DUF4402 domain-containing protein n=1 Tax=Niabella pedocola TaxID=1752077 RepID=A0ABS8PY76_9BACT|nr:hypothetical protein [Niabella pedocola]MCD2426022.1 hypothetical protein [Niabella pedocola]